MKVIINKILYIKLWSTAIVSTQYYDCTNFYDNIFYFCNITTMKIIIINLSSILKLQPTAATLCTIFLLHHPIATEIQAVIQFNPLLWEYNCWTSSSLFYYARTATKDRKIMQPNSLTGLGPLSPAFNNLLELIKELPGLLHRCSPFNFLWALKKI